MKVITYLTYGLEFNYIHPVYKNVSFYNHKKAK